jgi:hypothetical protein
VIVVMLGLTGWKIRETNEEAKEKMTREVDSREKRELQVEAKEVPVSEVEEARNRLLGREVSSPDEP